MSPLWNGLAKYKDHISSLQSIMATIALLVGGAWVLLHFDLPSELEPDINIQQNVTTYPVMDDATVLQVDVTLSNSGKRSAIYYCGQTHIQEFSPLSDDNKKKVQAGLGPDIDFDLKPPPMKSFHYQVELVAPAGGSALWRKWYSVSPFVYYYIPSTLDKRERIKNIGITSNFYADKDCFARLTNHEKLKSIGVSSIFDMETNKTLSTTVQSLSNSSPP